MSEEKDNILLMEDKQLKNGEIKLRVTSDEIEVYAEVVSAENGGKDATYEDALIELKSAGVEYGINEEQLKDVFDNRMFDSEILIANGLLPVDGIDGEVRYFFDTHKEIKPKEDEKGNVDFKDLNIIQALSVFLCKWF